MTDRELMQQAQLEKLEGTLWMLSQQLTRKQAEIDALRERLAQPEQESVALQTVYETIIKWDEAGGKRGDKICK